MGRFFFANETLLNITNSVEALMKCMIKYREKWSGERLMVRKFLPDPNMMMSFIPVHQSEVDWVTLTEQQRKN